MSVGDAPLFLTHVAVCLVAVLALAWLGRGAARRLRQPEVIGEITGGLLAGPAVKALVGTDVFGRLLPGDVLHALKTIGEAGLALLLVGLTHELRTGAFGPGRRTMSWIVFGALVPPLCTGALLVGWVLLVDDPTLRGTSPLPAFALFTAVAMSITAVPVLARLLSDRGLTTSREGQLALTCAIILDGVGWILLSVAVGLDKGSVTGTLRVLTITAAVAVTMLLLGPLLHTEPARAWVTRFPRSGAAAVGAGAIAAALISESLGLSMIFGAVLFGLAMPTGTSSAWTTAVTSVTGLGRQLVPVFFVVTGVTVFTKSLSSAPWTLLILTTVLGTLGKIGGGCLGALLGGESRWTAARLGVLLNTRGLTELIVLQVGYSAGMVTPSMFLALVVMALATTTLTGPLLSLLDRARARLRAAQPPSRRQPSTVAER
ncbi:cation:proton antiporter [Streptomyces sp. NPDC052101]|uniref:cation:proton antiporter n=1 Tax=Streptomyces sp. NPDC052101 TaxID=3155763 RepID=UPI00343E7BCD